MNNARTHTNKLLAIVAFLYLAVIGLQVAIDPMRKHYVPLDKTTGLQGVGEQSTELLGGVLLGFREVAAGLLWVRADEYFHSGRYAELVPLVYVVTWLDPHQLDVYSTGAWHLAYNLGDQRLIPEGVKFLQKGIKDNPNVYDLFFQQGWMFYNKVKDYDKAVAYFREAVERKGTEGENAPSFMRNQIAHGLEKSGRIDEMFEQWRVNIRRSKVELLDALKEYGGADVDALVEQQREQFLQPESRLELINAPEVQSLANKEPDVKAAIDALAVQIQNLDTATLRREYFRKGAGEPGYRFNWDAKPYPRWEYVGGNERHRINTNFDYKVEKIGPRKLKVTGHIEGADFYNKNQRKSFTRLDVLFRDKNYAERYASNPNDFEWQKDNLTWYRKQVSFPTEDTSKFKPGQLSDTFEFILDFSKDPEDNNNPPEMLFPLKADDYELTVRLDPTDQSKFHQDVFGWRGEGLTDDRHLVVDKRGVRTISKTVTLDRSDVL